MKKVLRITKLIFLFLINLFIGYYVETDSIKKVFYFLYKMDGKLENIKITGNVILIFIFPLFFILIIESFKKEDLLISFKKFVNQTLTSIYFILMICIALFLFVTLKDIKYFDLDLFIYILISTFAIGVIFGTTFSLLECLINIFRKK
ncbi:MAG: hypothetical protein WCO35_01645 [Candidatus Nomurabacteria bacterium]